MRITGVRAIVTCPGRNYVAVKVLTDQPGLYGVGDATLNGRELAVAATLEEHIAPLLIGQDPDRIEHLWQYLYKGAYWRGGPVQMTALAGIDLALWDIKGKRAGLPVYSLLGGRCRDGALAYTHAWGRDAAEVEAHCRALMAEGYRALRVRFGLGSAGTGPAATAGGDPAREGLPPVELFEPAPYLRQTPALFERLRDALGPEVELIHDVHQRLTPPEAAGLARALEPVRLLFLEDCLPPEQHDGYRMVRGQTSTPLATGELLHTKWECLPLLTGRLIDYIRCDLGHVGGLTEARKIAALAETFVVRTAWHGPGDVGPAVHAANVHLSLAVPNFGIQETVRFHDAVHEVMPGAPVFRDGALDVSDRPGLGVDLDEAAAARHPYRRAYLPTARRADGGVTDW